MCETTPTMRLELPMDEQAPGRARRFLREAICPVHAASVLDSAQLLVSELVTNGIRYGAPPLSVLVDCDGSAGLRVTVSDGGVRGVPRARQAGSQEESGRGLALIDYVSDAWGIEPREEGKAVWFSLAPEDEAA
ncbi:ATP-binding protein [Kineococcus sp. SYSU DK005]|uniref:ATP-binding protein n=1 Tax=Kineococcus sp. SYSU DK005 TaxID=3383126 RepID=UPI003D7EF814